MLHALVEILGLLVDAMRQASDVVPRVAASLIDDLMRITTFAALPASWVLLLAAIAVASVLFAAIAFVHWAVVRARRPVATVFISYEHRREATAAAVEHAFGRAGLLAHRLPFLDEVVHDELLDAVRSGVHGCDVFVCVPGDRSSFVDVEVSMAFALGKPMVFVLDAASGSRLPNTAKKGYPLFDERALRARNYTVLVAFVRLIAADAGTVLQPYRAAVDNLFRSFALVLGVWLLCLSIGSLFIDKAEIYRLVVQVQGLPQSLWSGDFGEGPLLIYTVVNGFLIALPFAAYALAQAWLRLRVRSAVAGQRFATLALPQTLEPGLARAELVDSLCTVDVLAHHERRTPAPTVQGRTLPLVLTQSVAGPVLGIVLGLLIGLGSLALLALAGVDGWPMLSFALVLLIVGIIMSLVGIATLPDRVRRLDITADGFSYFGYTAFLRGKVHSVHWSEVEGFEWVEVGRAWAITWTSKHFDAARAAVWSNGYGLPLPELMSILRELHEGFTPASQPENPG